mgnify:CR=1 FL=1
MLFRSRFSPGACGCFDEGVERYQLAWGYDSEGAEDSGGHAYELGGRDCHGRLVVVMDSLWRVVC